MPKLYVKGKVCSGSTSYASAVSCTDKSGNKSTVQNEINELNKNLSNLGGFIPVIDETGKITGYKTNIGGADTVFPFSGGAEEMTFGDFTGKAWSFWQNSETPTIPTVTYDENSITFTSINGQQGVSLFPIDLTNVDFLYMHIISYSNASYALFGICDKDDSSFNNAEILYGSTSGSVDPQEELALDCRKYTGIHYLFIRTMGVSSANSYVTLDKLAFKSKVNTEKWYK